MTSRHTNLQAPHPLRKPKLASPCGSQSVGLGHEHTTKCLLNGALTCSRKFISSFNALCRGQDAASEAHHCANTNVVGNRMGQIYLKFNDDKARRNSDDKPKTWLTRTLEKSVVKILTTIIPKANPDFEDKLQDVKEWLIEIDEEAEIANREIGINNEGQTIMIMPFGDNHGYWTDNNLKPTDFIELFQATTINRKEFTDRWDKFEKDSD
jgi:hypothetical protein